MHIWPINQIPWPHKLPHPETSTPTHTHICWHTPLLWETESPTAAVRAGGWGRGKPRGMGRIWVCHVNNSQVARAGGHSVINVPPHSRHLTRGCIPGVMGSSWTEVSGSTAENKLGRPLGNTHNYLPSESQTCSLPARWSQPGNHFRSPVYRGMFAFDQCDDFVCKFINNFPLLWFENADLSIA